MSVRDAPLALFDPITAIGRLLPAQKAALAKLGIKTIRDLLFHFPVRYLDPAARGSVAQVEDGAWVTVFGRIETIGTKKSFRGGVPMAEATIRDASGKAKLTWFHQPYIAKTFAVGDIVRATGEGKQKSGVLVLVNPETEKVPSLPTDVAGSLFAGSVGEDDILYPVYPESRGITSRWFYHSVRRAIARGVLDKIEDPLPDDVRERYHLPGLVDALHFVHMPRDVKHAEAAKKRFAFQEIFGIHLARAQARRVYLAHETFRIPEDEAALARFRTRIGFPLTGAQERAIAAIRADLAEERPMLRLLEGDVGSGKTAVAAAATEAVVTATGKGLPRGTLQVAYLCPTEILATQQFEGFIKHFIGSGLEIGLITGSGCRKFPSKVDPSEATDISRTQLLKWVASGQIAVLVGTHALVQKTVKFAQLALAIIDEQHRFGTKQRMALVQKDGRIPHLLSMTATPIPRTLALSVYGDLDLSVLDEMPAGRKPVLTTLVGPQDRVRVEAHLRESIAEGRQAYVICPRIDEPDPEKEDALMAKSVIAEAERLRTRVFPGLRVGLLHGKMRPAEKDAAMEAFVSGETNILVATSVVEVGVNVPNATIIIIEGADRYGLAQLHQLRGRVLRGTYQPHCYLFAEAKSKETWTRLKALVDAKDGFALAEMDLTLRGAGELGGGKQWGVSDVGMEALRNPRLVEAARTEASRILEDDPELRRYPLLRALVASQGASTHGE